MIIWLPRPCRFAHGRSRRAFTLIELLVVIVILGILMAVAVPTFLRQQSKAQDSRTQQYLTTAYKAIRSGTPDTNNQYPQSTTMVSWVQQSEPELTAQRGSCTTQVQTAPQDAVLVDPSSTANGLVLCARSQSGNVFKLTATAAGVQQLLDGTLVPLTMSGNEITDATRAANTQGDGLSGNSSYGIWEATTNLVTNGGLETDASQWWGNSSSTITRVTTEHKFGSASLQVITPGSVTIEGARYSTPTSTTFNVGDAYVGSAWVKAPTGATLLLSLDEAGAYNISTTAFTGTGSWQYVTTNGTIASGRSGSFPIGLQVYTTGTAQALTFYIDGAQVEKKPFATPYVETNGATAARGRGQVQASTSLLSQTQGWVAVRIRTGPSLYQADGQPVRVWGFGGCCGSNWMSINSGGAPGWAFDRLNSTGTRQTLAVGSALQTNTLYTVIMAWNTTTDYGSVNGSAFSSLAVSGTVTWPATFTIGSDNNAVLNGDVLWFACGTGTLSNADAATINSWGNSDPKVAAFPAAAQTTMVWNGTSSTGSMK